LAFNDLYYRQFVQVARLILWTVSNRNRSNFLCYVPFIHSYLLRVYSCSFVRIVITAAYGRPRKCKSMADRGKFLCSPK